MLFPRCTNYLNKENGDSVKVFSGLFITRPCWKGHVERVTTRKSFFIERGNLTLERNRTCDKHSFITQLIFEMKVSFSISTPQKMNFFIKNFFSKCDEIHSFLRIWSHFLQKSLMENFIFCAMLAPIWRCPGKFHHIYLKWLGKFTDSIWISNHIGKIKIMFQHFLWGIVI